MATLREIVDAAVELKVEADKLEAFRADRDRLQTQLDITRTAIQNQTVVVDQKQAALKALL